MKQKNIIFITLLILIILIIGIYFIMEQQNTKVLLKTNHGDITIELYSKQMPSTAGNFENLVKQGTYDKVIFHRIIDGFMIQGGDPTGTGMGDSSIPNIQDEFTKTDLDKNNRGTISMANAGPNTGSSQFFINLANNNFLDGKHPVFGKVVDGMDVVDKLAKVQTDSSDKPLEDVVILEARVLWLSIIIYLNKTSINL